MAKPVIKFKLNRGLDKETCFNFLTLKYAGVDFGKGITYYHPKLKAAIKIRSASLRKKIISDYVIYFYKKNQKELEGALDFFSIEWKKIEKLFFKETNKIFKQVSWPKGRYICYLSVFNCNPRFLHNKTFQVFYRNKKDIRKIIVHELLHFIFYEYFDSRNYRKLSAEKKWVISEVFNAIILNQHNFKKLITPAREEGYPEHRRYIKALTKEWETCQDVTMWLERAREIVR